MNRQEFTNYIINRNPNNIDNNCIALVEYYLSTVKNRNVQGKVALAAMSNPSRFKVELESIIDYYYNHFGLKYDLYDKTGKFLKPV